MSRGKVMGCHMRLGGDPRQVRPQGSISRDGVEVRHPPQEDAPGGMR